MSGLSIAAPFDRARLAAVADALMVAVAVALPWSTSAVGILLVLWLLALIPTLDWPQVRRELLTAAGGLPVLLCALGVIGMAWADVSWAARWGGLNSFFRLLAIPLLIVQFRRSENGHRVFLGFLIACIALLIASWAVAIWRDLPKGSTDFGVAVKSYIVQSVEFAICAAGLLYLAVEAAQARRWIRFAVLFVIALAFLQDIFFVATGRTTLVIIPALVVVYGAQRFGRKGFVAAAIVAVVLAAGVWVSSHYVRFRVDKILTATDKPVNLHHVTPSEERFVFWTKSIRVIGDAPLIGHGTGSITEMFRRAAAGRSGLEGEVSTNPHNQTFAVGIQLGLLGIAALWAMWLAHFFLFRGGGLAAWIGVIMVTQNVVGSLFNSFLFDYTEGWLYVIGFGVVAGMYLRERDAARPAMAAIAPKT
ncbi:MAG: O-antigen ligase family protein [Pseudolabrys sp.]